MTARLPRNSLLFAALLATAAAAAEPRARIAYSEALERIAFAPRASAAGEASPGERLEFDAFGRRFALALEPNRRLLDAIDRQALGPGIRVYRGRVDGAPGSWTRLVVADGVPRGLVHDGRETYAIDAGGPGSAPVMYRLSDLVIEPGALSCGSGGAATSGAGLLDALGSEMEKAEALAPGADSQMDFGVVADFEFASDFGPDSEAALVTRMNNVDGIFSEQLGVQLNLERIDVFETESDPFSDATDAGDLLDELGEYRRNTPAQNANGLSHLFTGRNLDGSTVGIAYTGALCLSRFGVGLTEGSNNANFDSLVAAHEIGHNFGAPHDGESGSACEATSEDFLMAPRLNGSNEFSACSVEQMQDDIAGASCITPLLVTDIAVVAGSAPAGLLLGDAATVSFDVNGLGTETSEDVSLAITVPVGATLDDASATAGSCTSGAGTVDCSLGSIAAGSGVSVSLAVTTNAVGTLEFLATGAATVDDDAGNNDAALSITVEPVQQPEPEPPAAASDGGGGPFGGLGLLSLALAALRRIRARRGTRDP